MSIFKRHNTVIKKVVITTALVVSVYCAYTQSIEAGLVKSQVDETTALMGDIQARLKTFVADVDEREAYHSNAIILKEFTPRNTMTMGLREDGVFEAVLNNHAVTENGILNQKLFNSHIIGEKSASNGTSFYDLIFPTIYTAVGLPNIDLSKAFPTLNKKSGITNTTGQRKSGTRI